MGDGVKGLVALCLLASVAWGQEPSQGLRRRGGEAKKVVPAGVREVTVDVVVTDGNGQPVDGLGARDFRVTDGRVAGTVVRVVEGKPGTVARVDLEANEYSNKPLAFGGGATTIILLDAMDAQVAGLDAMREKLKAYLKKAPRGTALAIFQLAHDLRTVMPMTDDPEDFGAALVELERQPTPGITLGEENGTMQSREILRRQVLQDAMKALATYWSAYPGRKNLIWLTGAVPTDFAGGGLGDPFPDIWQHGGAVDAVALSELALYPMQLAPNAAIPTPALDRRGPASIGPTDDSVYASSANQGHAMEEIAAKSGGKAYRHAVGMKDPIADAVALGTHFYTITYRAAGAEAGERMLKVEAVRPELTATARSGYVVRTEEAKQEDAPVTEVHARTMINIALGEHQVPRQEIVFHARVQPVGLVKRDRKGAPAAKGEFLDAKLRQKGYRTYQIDANADARKIHFVKGEDGMYRYQLEFIAMLYDATGHRVNSMMARGGKPFDQAGYETAMREGMQVAETFSIPEKGYYVLRLAVVDTAGPVMGTVEIQGVSSRE